MTMIPEVELRKKTIPIFFDMMQCEFYSTKGTDDGNMRIDSKDPAQIKANFCRVNKYLLIVFVIFFVVLKNLCCVIYGYFIIFFTSLRLR